jgi:hypothetical protein
LGTSAGTWTPTIWTLSSYWLLPKRVLDTGLPLADQTALLLYADPSPIGEKDLAKCLEQDRPASYRRVLDKLHKARMAEWNKATGMVTGVWG